jgi:hypothetical protein
MLPLGSVWCDALYLRAGPQVDGLFWQPDAGSHRNTDNLALLCSVDGDLNIECGTTRRPHVRRSVSTMVE